MKIFNTAEAARSYLKPLRNSNQVIGFVPTMGALHKGHISLVEKAKKECDITVVSIFVNPTQFNDPVDLKNYPRTTDKDIKMLSEKMVDVLFIPGIHEVYPHPDKRVFDFGPLDRLMEGKFRPGHFNGVAQVVSILFEIITPNKAFFGQKDFQQLTIIRELEKQLDQNIEIISCPIIREENGLAMSSRNRLLNEKEKEDAGLIYKTLKKLIEKKTEMSPSALAEWAEKTISSHPALEVEYVQIVNVNDLRPAKDWGKPGEQVACVAVKINNVRLIDNVIFP